MKRLMGCLHARRLHPRGHRLDALRSPGSSSPAQYDRNGTTRSACPSADGIASTYASNRDSLPRALDSRPTTRLQECESPSLTNAAESEQGFYDTVRL